MYMHILYTYLPAHLPTCLAAWLPISMHTHRHRYIYVCVCVYTHIQIHASSQPRMQASMHASMYKCSGIRSLGKLMYSCVSSHLNTYTVATTVCFRM